MCNRGLEQTATSLSSCEAEFYAVRAQENCWVSQNFFKDLHYNVSSSSRDGFTFGTFHSEEEQEDPSIEMRCVAVGTIAQREASFGWTREQER